MDLLFFCVGHGAVRWQGELVLDHGPAGEEFDAGDEHGQEVPGVFYALHCLEEEIGVLFQQADVFQGEVDPRAVLVAEVSDGRCQDGVAPLSQDRFEDGTDDLPVRGVGLDPQRSIFAAVCVAVPAGVAGFTVLGGRFVVHWRPAEAAADETVKWGLGVVCMVMAGYSLLDSLVGDVCVGFYFRAAYFPSVVLQRIVTAKLHSGWAKREGDGWPPFCVPSKWNGLGSTEGSVRAGMSGGWCCSMWWGASEGPLTCLPSAPGKAKGG